LARIGHNDGPACLAGTDVCREGRRFSVNVVRPLPEDAQRVREAVTAVMLPSLRDSYNRVWDECGAVWNRTVGQRHQARDSAGFGILIQPFRPVGFTDLSGRWRGRTRGS
jgi:hypothetical protein